MVLISYKLPYDIICVKNIIFVDVYILFVVFNNIFVNNIYSEMYADII